MEKLPVAAADVRHQIDICGDEMLLPPHPRSSSIAFIHNESSSAVSIVTRPASVARSASLSLVSAADPSTIVLRIPEDADDDGFDRAMTSDSMEERSTDAGSKGAATSVCNGPGCTRSRSTASATYPKETPCSGTKQLFFAFPSDKTVGPNVPDNETFVDLKDKLTMLSQFLRDVKSDYRRRRKPFCIAEENRVVRTCKTFDKVIDNTTSWNTGMSSLLCKIYYGLKQVNKGRKRALKLEIDFARIVRVPLTFKKSLENIYHNSVYGLRPIRCLIANALAQFPGEWETCHDRMLTCKVRRNRRRRRTSSHLTSSRAERSQPSNRSAMFRRNCKRIDIISRSVEELSRNFSSFMDERFGHY